MEEKAKLFIEDFHLLPASLEEYPIIQNMGRFYVYDMSQFFTLDPEWKMPSNGLYECMDFKKYWQSDNTWPFILRFQEELAGFVIVDKKGSDIHIDYNMAQFFILRKFKNHGIGMHIAQRCFDKFTGVWEVMVLPGNFGAHQFWQKTINQYTNGAYEEYNRVVSHLSNSPKNIFKFSSRETS
ncbi:MAG: GNAT family N-acetyltransferase [Candidatus Berkiella sp.]